MLVGVVVKMVLESCFRCQLMADCAAAAAASVLPIQRHISYGDRIAWCVPVDINPFHSQLLLDEM
jgi:hypothetical protein